MTAEVKQLEVNWDAGLRFHAGEPGGPTIPIDADNTSAPGPMLLLLAAAASCTGSDIVIILEKMRVRLQSFRVSASGTRREAEPRRYTGIHFRYQLRGEGLDEAKARRAIDLSLEKYCSVVHSLASDIAISYELVLETG